MRNKNDRKILQFSHLKRLCTFAHCYPGAAAVCVVCACATFATTLVGTRAQAQSNNVQIYGNLDTGLHFKRLAGNVRAQRFGVDGGPLIYSRWGIRGSEKLSNGSEAFFNLRGHFRMNTGEMGRHAGDTATSRLWSNLSLVGLRGEFGELQLGRIPTRAFVNMLLFTPYGESPTFGPFLIHTVVGGNQPMLAARSGIDGIWNNSILYTSPRLAGFTASLQVAARGGEAVGRRVEGTLNYATGAFAAGMNYAKVEHASFLVPRTPTDPAGAPYVIKSMFSALTHLSYDFKVVKVFQQFGVSKLRPQGTAEISLKTIGLNAQIPIGTGRMMAAWARTVREQRGISDRSRNTFSMGYIYDLSKRTELYAVSLYDRATGLAVSGTAAALGMRHRF